jgi:hypothetical protein
MAIYTVIWTVPFEPLLHAPPRRLSNQSEKWSRPRECPQLNPDVGRSPPQHNPPNPPNPPHLRRKRAEKWRRVGACQVKR